MDCIGRAYVVSRIVETTIAAIMNPTAVLRVGASQNSGGIHNNGDLGEHLKRSYDVGPVMLQLPVKIVCQLNINVTKMYDRNSYFFIP